MVLTSSFPELVIPKVSFFKYNVDQMMKHGNKVSIIDAQTGRQLTYNEILKGCRKLASALTRRGLEKQEVVAICASNCIEYSTIVLGVAACNAITTTCNPRYTLEETLQQFENCQPRFIFTDADQVGKILEIAKRVPSIQEVFSINQSSTCVSLWTLIEQDDGGGFPFDVIVNPHEDVILLPYSSGTTGLPKGVMLTHENFIALLVMHRALSRLPKWMVTYSVIPMFHSYGLARIFGNLVGYKYVIDQRFKVKRCLEAIQKYKINSLSGVPQVLMDLSNSPLLDKYDISSLVVIGCGAAPLAPKVAVSSMQKLKAVLVQGWGLTECLLCTFITMVNTPMNAVGFVAPNTALKVVDPETRKELGVNQDGELLLKGPQAMKGYYKNPKANSITFEQGWLCTGDAGHYDEHGLVYISDRLKELIKYKGFQVAPAELESLLLNHPKVKDVGVVGIPDASAGEVPRAFIVKADSSLTESEVHQFVEKQVSRYKYLNGGVQFIDEVPRSAAGKILRRRLAKGKPDSKL